MLKPLLMSSIGHHSAIQSEKIQTHAKPASYVSKRRRNQRQEREGLREREREIWEG